MRPQRSQQALRPRALHLLFLGALLVGLTGCRSLSSYYFGPSPQVHELAIEGQVTPVARVQISALGFVEAAGGIELLFRMRIENPETPGLRLKRDAFELVDGRLTSFGKPWFGAVPGDQVGVGGSILVDFGFPLPAGSKPKTLDLSGVVLTWGVETDAQQYVTTASFQELYYYYPCGCGGYHTGRYGYYHPGYGYNCVYRW